MCGVMESFYGASATGRPLYQDNDKKGTVRVHIRMRPITICKVKTKHSLSNKSLLFFSNRLGSLIPNTLYGSVHVHSLLFSLVVPLLYTLQQHNIYTFLEQ